LAYLGSPLVERSGTSNIRITLAVTYNRVIADAPPRFARQHALGDTLRHSVPREVDRSIVAPQHLLEYNCDFYSPRRHPVQSSQFGHIGPLLSVDPRFKIMPERKTRQFDRTQFSTRCPSLTGERHFETAPSEKLQFSIEAGHTQVTQPAHYSEAGCMHSHAPQVSPVTSSTGTRFYDPIGSLFPL
jgi:hypothetical protein